MKVLLTLATALAAGSVGSLAAAAPMQPPMNNFNYAFYTCDDGGSFLMTYDDNPPKSATMTTNNDNKNYALKRQPVASGVQFSGDGAKFWTDGKSVTVDGTVKPFRNCKLKPS